MKSSPSPSHPATQPSGGELSRIVLSCLRQSPKPLTAQDIAQHIMAERGLNTADAKLMRLIGKRVGACLHHQREKGLVRSKPGPGSYLVWEMAR